MSKTAMVSINSKVILDALNDRQKTARQVSMDLGRSEAYLSGIVSRKKAPKSMLPILAQVLDIPVNRLTESQHPKSSLAPEQAAQRYHTEIQVWPDLLRMVLFFGDQELRSVYSRIKGDTELDLMQAISYAAHMLYKLSEQEALRKRE